MAKGRPRKKGKREPNGRPQRTASYENQLAHENQCVVIDARQRHLHVSKEQARDASAGHTMGVLHIRKQITLKQLEASTRYAEGYLRVHRLKGWPRPHPKIASYAQMIAGMASGYEPSEDEIQRAVEQWDNANNAIVNTLGIKAALPAIQALKTFVINQAHPDECTERREMALCAGCDVLVKHYGV